MANNEVGKMYERPWGMYQTIALDDGYQVKVITVNPGGCLSLQRHQHRSEHWVIIAGSPEVTVDDEVSTLSPNTHVFIPVTSIHRLENKGKKTVKIIEVQVGDYLGEDDIERLSDVYGRE